MSDIRNPYEDFIFSLPKEQFALLQEAVNKRIDMDRYSYSSFEEAALIYGRAPVCPKCGNREFAMNGFTGAGYHRYRCRDCECSYTLLTDSIFNSAKIPVHKLMVYLQLMSFNVPLELMCETLNIGANTAELWRKKVFETVNGYQDHLVLSGKVWIDETYIEDYEVLAVINGKHLRGLSRSKLCIVVAIDEHKNMAAIPEGHGKPASAKSMKALESHIQEGSHIIHDGDHTHNKLVKN